MARDDFSKDTNLRLAKRVAFRCSNPKCGQVTAGPADADHGTISIGVAAHITAASEGGPRFDPKISSEERSAIQNGIWLCQNCAKLIDADAQQFPAELLREWKGAAEHRTRADLKAVAEERPATAIDVALVRRDMRIQQKRHDYNLEISLRNTGTLPISGYYVELELPSQATQDLQNLVADRSDRTCSFLRWTTDLPDLYPGDKRVIQSIPYFMDEVLYWRHRDLFAFPVRLRVYYDGKVIAEATAPFKDLQNF